MHHAPPPLSFSCHSLKRLCLDVLLKNPHLRSDLFLDVKELLMRRSVFGSCLMQQRVEKIGGKPVLVRVIPLLYGNTDRSW